MSAAALMAMTAVLLVFTLRPSGEMGRREPSVATDALEEAQPERL